MHSVFVAKISLCPLDFFMRFVYDHLMADVIVFKTPEKETAVTPKTYNVEVTCYPDNLMFTVNDIQVNPVSLQQVADELEKIAQIIRTDVITRVIS